MARIRHASSALGGFGACAPPWVAALAVAVASLVSNVAHAGDDAEEEKPARMAIVMDAAADVAPWRASALAVSISDDISAYGRVSATPTPDVVAARACGTDLTCTLAAYRSAGFDMVMLATLGESRARYQLYQTWAPGVTRISGGVLHTKNSDEHQLRNEIRRLLDPVLRAGGALEHRRRSRTAKPVVAAPVTIDRGRVNQLLALIVIVLLIPFVIGWVIARDAGLGHVLEARTLRYTVGLVAVLVVASYASLVWEEQIAGARWAVLIAGGLAWGVFGVAVGQSVFPRFGGIERVEHRDVFRLIRAWSVVALQQLVRTALFYAPFFLAFFYAYRAVGLPRDIAITVVAPLWGLLARFWFMCIVDNLSLALDRQLVTGNGGWDDPWHEALSGYVLGYVKRAGWPADDTLLENVLFQPGTGDEVLLYGGGLTHARIVIGRGLLEYALAPEDRPHDYAGKREHKLSWSEWNVGLVVPVEMGSTIATKEQRMPRNPPIPGEMEHQPLGQPPTLAGYVEPYQLDRRTAFHPGEDPVWLDWDPTEEHDGTDPSDKDFLFGAIVRELGAVQRRDNQRRTLALTTTRWLRRRPLFGRIIGVVTRPFAALYSHYPVMVGDAFAALNFSRHHLIQYLAWRSWRDEELLTARAYAPELERVSKNILRALENEPDKRRKQDRRKRARAEMGVSPRQRLAWLSRFFREPVRHRLEVRSKRILVAGVCALALLALGLGIKQARDYHPTYVDRTTNNDKPAAQEPSAPVPKPSAPAKASTPDNAPSPTPAVPAPTETTKREP